MKFKVYITIAIALLLVIGIAVRWDRKHAPPANDPPATSVPIGQIGEATTTVDPMVHDSGGVAIDGWCCDPATGKPIIYDDSGGKANPTMTPMLPDSTLAFNFSPPQPSSNPEYISPPPQQINNSPQPTPQPPVVTTPKTMTTLEIISPIGTKGLGREYLARQEIFDEANYIELGVIVRDQNGNALDNVKVIITATDDEQNKTLESTGNVKKIYVDGTQQVVPYYPFHYAFKFQGQHKITFSSGGVSESVTLEVGDDTRQ